MKALVFYDVKDIRYEENWPVPPPPPPGFVKIKIDWCGICGTDIEDYLYGGVIPVHEPHPQSGCVAPIVIGHEFSGTVYETGRDVRNVAVGDKVAVECVVGCGTCYWCKLRDFGRCEQYLSIGQHCDGGFAEYVNVPAENCIVYSGVGADEIAVAEPLAVCVRALKKGRIKIGDSVAVVGAGPIGLCSIAVAKVAGASRVICIARGGHRAEVAVQMGADVVLNSREEGWEEQYWRETWEVTLWSIPAEIFRPCSLLTGSPSGANAVFLPVWQTGIFPLMRSILSWMKRKYWGRSPILTNVNLPGQ